MAAGDYETRANGEAQQGYERIDETNRVHIVALGATDKLPGILVLRRKRSTMERSTWWPGTIFLGAEARLVAGEGSMKLRINQRANHPSVISCTAEVCLSFSAVEIEGR